MNTANETINNERFKGPVAPASPSKIDRVSNYVQNGQYFIDPRLTPWNFAAGIPYNALTEIPVDSLLYSPLATAEQPIASQQVAPMPPTMLAATCRLQSVNQQQQPQYLMNLIAAGTAQAAAQTPVYAAPAHPAPDWSYLAGKLDYSQPAQFVDSKQLLEGMQALSLQQPGDTTEDRGRQLMFVSKDYEHSANTAAHLLAAPANNWLYSAQWPPNVIPAARPPQPRLAVVRGTRWPRPPTLSVNNLIKPQNKDLNMLQLRQDGRLPGFNGTKPESSVLQKLKRQNNFNPTDFDLTLKGARFFIIKSYSEDDVHRSIKYGIWCSTQSGNKRLNEAYKEREGKGAVYLFFSVNESSHFCGIAEMMSPVDYDVKSGVWVQDKWQGKMDVRWLYIKDVPNSQLRHIHLENNGNRPVTFSRDAQEVPFEKGRQVFQIIHSYKHESSLLDDFDHYEQRQKEQLRHKRSQQRTFPGQSRPPRKPTTQCECVQPLWEQAR